MPEPEQPSSALPSRSSFVTLVMAVAAFALLLVAVWTARNVAARQPDEVVNFARLVKVVSCFVLAYLFRSFIPSVHTLLLMGVACTLLGVGVYAAGLLIPVTATEYLPVGYLSSLFSGIGDAVAILVVAHVVSTFAPQVTAIAVPVVYLANEVMYLALSYTPSPALVVIRPVLELVGLALLATAARRSSRTQDPTVHELQFGIGGVLPPDERPLRFLSSSREWALLLIGTTLFPFIFGAVSQMGSVGSPMPGLYDITNEIAAIGLLCLLVLYGIVRGARFTYDEILAFSIPLFATGCLLLPLLASTAPQVGGMLVKCGYTLYQVTFWMLLTRKAHEDPRHTYLYFGVFYGLFELATLLARAAVYAWTCTLGFTGYSVWLLGLVALWLIGMYGLLFFLVSRRSEAAARRPGTIGTRASLGAGEETADAESAAPAMLVDALGLKLDAFCTDFNLTPREREVLAESIHGFSMEEAGRRLCITKDTVKTHLQRVYRKAGVAGKKELIAAIEAYPAP